MKKILQEQIDEGIQTHLKSHGNDHKHSSYLPSPTEHSRLREYDGKAQKKSQIARHFTIFIPIGLEISLFDSPPKKGK